MQVTIKGGKLYPLCEKGKKYARIGKAKHFTPFVISYMKSNNIKMVIT